ncbi:STAS domain-containing protein [Streptomyces sp. NPDC056269]|uniref:STAS domain-containing protein n=1 Tax=Streptomyces sp. NPDC056269 TaxID=3345768 RepID=UPI0035DB2B7B
MSNLNLTTLKDSQCTVITVAGDLDLTSCPALEDAACRAMDDGSSLRLDMSGVTFMDSSGLNLLLILRGRLMDGGGRLELTGVREAPMRVLTMTGADALLLPAGAGARRQVLDPTA